MSSGQSLQLGFTLQIATGGNLPLWTTYGKVKYGHLLDTRTRPIIISGCVLKKKQNIMWNLILS